MKGPLRALVRQSAGRGQVHNNLQKKKPTKWEVEDLGGTIVLHRGGNQDHVSGIIRAREDDSGEGRKHANFHTASKGKKAYILQTGTRVGLPAKYRDCRPKSSTKYLCRFRALDGLREIQFSRK